MSYKIVVDSCGELTEEMKQSGKVESVALSIQIDNENIMIHLIRQNFCERWQKVLTVPNHLVRHRNVIWIVINAMRTEFML